MHALQRKVIKAVRPVSGSRAMATKAGEWMKGE